MRRILYLFMILSLSIIVAACSGDDVENAGNLEGSDKSAEEKEMKEEETSDPEEATSSDSDNNSDSASASGEDSSDSGQSSGEGETSGSNSESDSGNTDSGNTSSGDSSSDGSGAGSSSNSGENSSDSGQSSDEGSENSSEGDSGSTGEAPSDDGHVNGTPRSEEEMSSATEYTFSELEGNAVEVIKGVSAADIDASNIPEAGAEAEVYMMVDDGQIIDMSYDSEEGTFNNLQIKNISPQTIKSATVYVTS